MPIEKRIGTNKNTIQEAGVKVDSRTCYFFNILTGSRIF